MNSDFPPHVWDFLSRLAADTAPQYREKLLGITQRPRDCGKITPKQLTLIKVSADRLDRMIPRELLWAGDSWRDDMPHAPQSAPDAAPDTAAVMADLLEGIAQAIARAARRLRP